MKQFFSEKGLTATSANHLANIAKELMKEEDSFLKNLNFVDHKVSLITLSNKKLLRRGNTEEDLAKITISIEKVSKMSAFIAWIREAIKAKEELTNDLRTETLEEYCNKNNIDLPKSPDIPVYLTEKDILKEFSVKELNEYYSLGAEAAKLGLCIHPAGGFAVARNTLISKISNPSDAKLNGSETIITEYEPSVNIDKVNELFLELQNKHRSIEARLNQIKYKIEQTLQMENQKIRSKFGSDLAVYSNKIDVIRNDYDSLKAKRLAEIQDLKIVIPSDLEEIFNYLNSVGRSKTE